MISTPVTYLFVGLALLGGTIAAAARNVLYAIIGLGTALFGVAGLFLLLGSPFVAAMQLLIYLGGITVAIVFAMMLSLAVSRQPAPRNQGKAAFAAVCVVVFGTAVFRLLPAARFPRTTGAAEPMWAVGPIGEALLTRHNLVFEALSVVLLVAIVGAILIARRLTGGERE